MKRVEEGGKGREMTRKYIREATEKKISVTVRNGNRAGCFELKKHVWSSHSKNHRHTQPFRQTPKCVSHPGNLFFFFRLKLKTLLLGFTSPFIPCFCHLASHLYVYLSLYPLCVAWLPIFVVCLCFAASTMENFGCTRCEMRLYWSVCLCGSVCVCLSAYVSN